MGEDPEKLAQIGRLVSLQFEGCKRFESVTIMMNLTTIKQSLTTLFVDETTI